MYLTPFPFALYSLPRVYKSWASFGQFGLVKCGPCLRSVAAQSHSYLQRISRHVPKKSGWPRLRGGGAREGPAYRAGHAPAKARPHVTAAPVLAGHSPQLRVAAGASSLLPAGDGRGRGSRSELGKQKTSI